MDDAKKSILKKLYDGEVYPSEEICADNLEYKRINNALWNAKADFLKNLSISDKESYEKIEDLQSEASRIHNYESFAYGFQLAVKIFVESLTDKDSST